MLKKNVLLFSAALLASSPVMAGNFKDVVRDARGVVVKDSRGNCVLTKWDVETDNCLGTPPAPPVAYVPPVAPPPPPPPAAPRVVQLPPMEREIYFNFDSSRLTPAANSKLDRIAQHMQQQGAQQYTLQGFADRSGSDNYNIELSRKRVHAVMEALAARKIDSGKFRTNANGEKNLPYPTKDGVKDGRNRMVRIDYY